MKENDLKIITESLIDVFNLAGNESIDLFKKGLKIEIKSDNSPVSNGDLKVNQLICNKIKELTPDIPIISEETVNLKEKNKFKIFWLIDPIDGTKEYIAGKSEYTLNAALVINQVPKIGIVGVPKKKQLFYSYGKNQSFLIQNNKIKNINCEKKTPKNEIIAVSSVETPSEEILNKLKNYRVTSIVKMASSYKFCVIANGDYDIYAAKERANEWDYAAGHAVASNAGALITTLDKKPFLYGKEDYKNPSLLILRSTNLND
ncbi:3'(2'),5'-bisphosphate nucleotidase CysQ [Pelagibacteraceae bacterium]|nr:3'(2'),5'-bisphosphate nucleotidase CysQ [Pelagibacteraceae bacterium]